jgi:translocon-associated protein subunit gamma
MSNQKSISRDEDLLLQDFSRNVTTKSWALFIGNAVVVSAIPLCKSINSNKNNHQSILPSGLFWRIHQMDITSYFIHFIIGTVVSTYFLNYAYQNMKFILKHK